MNDLGLLWGSASISRVTKNAGRKMVGQKPGWKIPCVNGGVPKQQDPIYECIILPLLAFHGRYLVLKLELIFQDLHGKRQKGKQADETHHFKPQR